MPLNSESYRAVLPRKKDCSNVLHHYTKTTFEEICFWPKIPKIMVGATIVEFCKELLDGDRLIVKTALYIRVALTSGRLVRGFSISNYHLQAHLPI